MSRTIEHLLPRQDQAVRIALSASPALTDAVMASLAHRLQAGAVLWDLRPLQEAQRAPIRGAVNLGQVDWLAEDRASGQLQPPSVIAKILARVGIRSGRPVILYAGDRTASLSLARRALESIDIDQIDVLVARSDDQAAVRAPVLRPVQHDAACA